MKEAVGLSVVVACTTGLCGCTGSAAPPLAPLQQVAQNEQTMDCRQPGMLYEVFSVYAKQLNWQSNALSVIFAFKNISSSPASIAGGRAGRFDVGLTGFSLVSNDGTRYSAELTAVGYIQFKDMATSTINPGITAEGKVEFVVPKDEYLLQAGIPADNHGVVPEGSLTCRITP
jgi:hypothetical protein